MMPKVSVIVPNYNHASFLIERLDSIFNQTFNDFEVILLDDASNDNSIEILKKYARDNRVSHLIINEKNSGSPFVQWNKGLEFAKGEYIWIAESDDTCALDFLESQLNAIKKADVVIAKTLSFQKNKNKTRVVTHPIFDSSNKEILLEKHFTFNCPIRNVSAIVFKNLENDLRDRTTFSTYKIIGDLIFYYEVFHEKQIVYNVNTTSYFRQNNQGISSINSKDLKHFVFYFDEQIKFIKNVFNQNNTLSKNYKKTYIKRKYNKIRNRVTRKEKVSINFLSIYLKFAYFNWVN